MEGPALRVVNYHSVPERFVEQFRRQLAHVARSHRIAAASELPQLIAGVSEPTLVMCFDDGLKSTIVHGARVVEEVGGRAVFAIPAAWPDVPRAQQASWFREHVYPVPTELHDRPGDVAAASWDELRDLVRREHAIWSHGFDHRQLTTGLAADVLEREIRASRAVLEEQLGTQVPGYCPPVSYDVAAPEAERLIAETYELAFGGAQSRVVTPDPLHIPRINLEASWPLDVVDFQLTRAGDLTSRLAARARR